jgi:hypothetical protein
MKVPTGGFIGESRIDKSTFPWTRHRGNPHWKPRHRIWTVRLRRGTCHAIVRSRDPRHQASGLAGLETVKRSESFAWGMRVRGSRGVGDRHIGVSGGKKLLQLEVAIRDIPTEESCGPRWEIVEDRCQRTRCRSCEKRSQSWISDRTHVKDLGRVGDRPHIAIRGAGPVDMCTLTWETRSPDGVR